MSKAFKCNGCKRLVEGDKELCCDWYSKKTEEYESKELCKNCAKKIKELFGW